MTAGQRRHVVRVWPPRPLVRDGWDVVGVVIALIVAAAGWGLL